MISVGMKGDFSKTLKYFEELQDSVKLDILNEYGRKGVDALSSATPVNTGLTAASWYYKIVKNKGSYSIQFCNSNVDNNVLVAILLQYGHGTGTGGWVEGLDYINPALQPVFDQLAESVWKEITSL